ncbi:MAG TPA: 60S ribosomal export protein NMD3 [Thermoplasmata archaeon]|nr:60S ribosomal export protein NMD3 [Thermoplasmata archaeon]
MFCVECGAEGPTYGGVCAKCFAKKHPLVEPPANVDVPRCKSCGRFRFRSGWSRTDLDLAIAQVLAERIQPLPPFSKVRFTHVAREEDENNHFLTVKATGRHEGLEQLQDFHARLRIKPSLCDLCQRQAGRYFEGILQVRGEGRDLTPAEMRGVRTLVLVRVERGREDAGDFVSKVEEVHGGLDFYLSTNALGLRLAKEIADTMGGTVASSPKLYGQREGKELYRVTSLVRLPAVRVGDVVRHKGALAEVLDRKAFVGLRDLATGETRRYKTKDLRDLRRVDVERFEAEIRVDQAGQAVAVHPESGAERRVDLHGKRPPRRARVVWTQDSAYLSGLRADASKD